MQADISKKKFQWKKELGNACFKLSVSYVFSSIQLICSHVIMVTTGIKQSVFETGKRE